jgi:hypothetical protein
MYMVAYTTDRIISFLAGLSGVYTVQINERGIRMDALTVAYNLVELCRTKIVKRSVLQSTLEMGLNVHSHFRHREKFELADLNGLAKTMRPIR